MLEIKITDPHLMDKIQLRKLGTFLFVLAGDEISAAPMPTSPVLTSDALDELTERVVAETTGKMPAPAKPLYTPEELNNPFDTVGMPWDARIHSRERSKNDDGTWRRKRGVTPAKVLEVEAELRNSIVRAPAMPFATPVPVGEPVTATLTPPPPTPLIEETEALTFPQLVMKAQVAMSNGKLTKEELNEILSSFQMTSLAQVSTKPELISTIATLIDAKLMEKAA